MTNVTFIAGLAALAASCSTRGGDRIPSGAGLPPAVPGVSAAPAGPRRAPVTLKLEGPQEVQVGGEIGLRVVIDRTTRGQPLRLRVHLPAGVELVSGRTREEINDPSGHVERTLVIRFAGIPADDVTASVDEGGVGYGVHATSAYRFGRADPKLPQPPRTGSPVNIGGKDIGTPIPLR